MKDGDEGIVVAVSMMVIAFLGIAIAKFLF
jgi:hypothetical protein